MSLIVTVFVNEGIVMASDSRSTYSKFENGKSFIGVHSNNSTNKTFLCPNNCGISVCGEASVKNQPITGFIEEYIRENVFENTDIQAMPESLNNYFKKINPKLQTNFTVAGYNKNKEQIIYKVNIANSQITSISTDRQGATWDGEIIVLSKLFSQLYTKDKNDNFVMLPKNDIPWNFFTLQDAVDFAKFAIKTTIDTMHFMSVVETVGGDIDILVIQPNKSSWISKKELHI